MKRIISLAAACCLWIGAFAADNATAVFTVSPAMSCQNCVNKIKNNLRFEKGVKNVDPSLKAQTVTVTFDPDKCSEQKLIDAFRKIGYTATQAESKAKAEKKAEANTGATQK